jgi:hypothetical protein
MPPRTNPLKLNPLQAKTLTILQELARSPATSTRDPESGDVIITLIPQPHGNHMHVGRRVVATKDATGLDKHAVWNALQRKGLAHGGYPYAIRLTAAGVAYDTGLRDEILHGSDHDGPAG